MRANDVLSVVLAVIAITLIASSAYDIPRTYFGPVLMIAVNMVTITLCAASLMRSLADWCTTGIEGRGSGGNNG